MKEPSQCFCPFVVPMTIWSEGNGQMEWLPDRMEPMVSFLYPDRVASRAVSVGRSGAVFRPALKSSH